MRNALADLGRPAPPTAIAVRRTPAGIAVRVNRKPDPRVQQIVVRRDGAVVCRTATGRCVDRGGPRQSSSVYSAVAVDEWGQSQPIVSRRIVVPKRRSR
jgi:hypothetical protein